MYRRAPLFGAVLGAFALVLGGCGNRQDRHEVAGAVTLRGRPLDDGIIQFDPLDGQATGGGAQIVQGKYVPVPVLQPRRRRRRAQGMRLEVDGPGAVFALVADYPLEEASAIAARRLDQLGLFSLEGAR
jgi:hypothetical protein